MTSSSNKPVTPATQEIQIWALLKSSDLSVMQRDFVKIFEQSLYWKAKVETVYSPENWQNWLQSSSGDCGSWTTNKGKQQVKWNKGCNYTQVPSFQCSKRAQGWREKKNNICSACFAWLFVPLEPGGAAPSSCFYSSGQVISTTDFVPTAIKARRHTTLIAISERGWPLSGQQGARLLRGCPSVTSTVRLKAQTLC